MDDEEIEKTVVAYLRKKGFRHAELALQEDRSRLSSSSNLDPRLKSGAARYHDGYSKLRSWAYSSLDLYRHELLRVLYPVFIHCFMDLVAEGHMQEARTFFHAFRQDHELMHLRDLQKLEGILSPSHLEEMELACTLRKSKVNIKLCEYSYNLLLQYIQKTQALTMLGILNEHINFEVTSGQPISITDDEDVVALVGSSQELAKQINQKEVRWGLLEDSVEERLERALSDSEKVDGENKDADAEENKCVQWHVNCNYIATGSSDKTVRLWDVQTGECARIFIGHRSMVISLAMSPDGRYMASGDEDGTIMMWDLSSGRCVSHLTGHSSCVWTLAFSCEGTLLASGSADCTVKLWDVTSSTKALKVDENKGSNANRLRLLKSLPTKSTPVYSLQFSRRNLLFAAGALTKRH